MVSVRVTSVVSSISVVESGVSVWVTSISVVAIEESGVSLSLRLGLWLTGDKGGKANLGE